MISVLLADDQEMVRTGFRLILSAEADIAVVGEAGTGVDAVARARALRPDVVLMDIRMPRMDGITFLRKLMAQCPLPVVMCSSLTEQGSDTMVQALEAGAVDVILKPRVGLAEGLRETITWERARIMSPQECLA